MTQPRRQARKGDLALLLAPPECRIAKLSGRVFEVLSDPFMQPTHTRGIELCNAVNYSGEEHLRDFGYRVRPASEEGTFLYVAPTEFLYPLDKGNPDDQEEVWNPVRFADWTDKVAVEW